MGEHAREFTSDCVRRGAREITADVSEAVGQHPAGDSRVVHHEHVAADDADELQAVPVCAGRFELLEREGR